MGKNNDNAFSSHAFLYETTKDTAEVGFFDFKKKGEIKKNIPSGKTLTPFVVCVNWCGIVILTLYFGFFPYLFCLLIHQQFNSALKRYILIYIYIIYIIIYIYTNCVRSLGLHPEPCDLFQMFLEKQWFSC